MKRPGLKFLFRLALAAVGVLTTPSHGASADAKSSAWVLSSQTVDSATATQWPGMGTWVYRVALPTWELGGLLGQDDPYDVAQVSEPCQTVSGGLLNGPQAVSLMVACAGSGGANGVLIAVLAYN